MPALTRGPLPARVYWVRRLLVLGTAVLLVVGIARLLGGGSDASSSADEAARVAAGTTSSSTTSATASDTALPSATPSTGRPGKRASKSQEPVLAEPTGPCADEDIAVTPEVAKAVAGRDVMIVLQLRSLSTPACTWQVSPGTLTVKITSGKDGIWFSRECPRAIPAHSVVVRQAVTTTVGVTWSSRRSDETCSKLTEWAMPGFYHVTAAALGGEPSDAQFELQTPTAVTITKTASPTHSPSAGPSGRPVTPSRSPSKSHPAAAQPSG
jgi:hypothetical protein